MCVTAQKLLEEEGKYLFLFLEQQQRDKIVWERGVLWGSFMYAICGASPAEGRGGRKDGADGWQMKQGMDGGKMLARIIDLTTTIGWPGWLNQKMLEAAKASE